MAKRKDREQTADFERRLSFRVKEDEYSVLQAEADKHGFSVSQAIRYLVFKKKNVLVSPENISEKEAEYRRSLAVKNIAAALKNIAALLAENNAAYERALMLLDGDGKPLVSTEYTVGLQSEIIQTLIDMQKEISEAVKTLGGQPVHYIAKNASIAKRQKDADAARPIDETINYYYMQKVTICGNIAAEPSVISTKGAEKVRFMMLCDDVFDGVKTTTRYSVVINKTGVVDYLKKGRQVFVVGEQKIRMKKDDKGVPFVDITVYSDSLTLGRD